MEQRTRANLLLLLTAIIWGTSFVAQVDGMNYITPLAFNFSRNVLSTVVMGLLWISIPRLRQETSRGTTLPRATILGGIASGAMLGIAMGLQQYGVSYTTAGKAGFITALYIVFVPVCGVFLGRYVKPKQWLSVAIATVGLYLLSMSGGLNIQIGDSIVLLCAFAYTGHIVVIDYFSPRANSFIMSGIQFAVAALLSGIAMLMFESFSLHQALGAWLPLFYTGVLSSCVGYTIQIFAQKTTDATTASLILSLEAVFAVIAGMIILNETMSGREWMGVILMFIAIILAQLPQRRKVNQL